MLMQPLPHVVLVGGPDVDARLELMKHLKGDFQITALGSVPTLRDRFVAEGFDYRAYRLARRANPLADVLALCQLVVLMRKLKPQIVHTFDTKPGVWARLAAKLAGVPIVIGTLPGLGSLYGEDDWKKRLLRLVYEPLRTATCRLSDLTIFQNHDDARECITSSVVSQEKAKVILGSGLPTDAFAPSRVPQGEQARLREEFRIQPDEVVVTMISRVIRSKGVLEFMDAARVVGRDCPKARFLLIGPDDRGSLDALNASELDQLKQAVTWPGPRKEIPAILSLTDIFVLPSALPEGIPRVLLEAASMGLPIVTTDAPGCNEVVEDGVNGYLVPTRDVAALSRAILRLTDQPAVRQHFGQVSRQRAVERFDISVIAAQTQSVYHELLSGKCTR